MRTKRFLSIVLTLAMLLGMFPGMSLTASAADSTTEITPSNTSGTMTITLTIAAAQTEELLTTITATAKEQASYNPENVATVSFSYTAGGSSAYLANWGWWGYGWTATVAPANGYTITKCVFYDDANRTATDSEAPFVVETTEEDKTPRINGTPIDGGNYQSKGLKKIEVYGYATPASSYSVTITAGDHITKTTDSGAASQTDLTGAMADVVYTADNGYYFPTDYSVAEVSGIKVTRDSYTQITVSGTPTADATITLTVPTAKTKPDAPTTASAANCTTADNNDGKLIGVTTAMEYKKSDADSWTAGTGSDITGLVPGTYYVRVKATDTTNASANQTLTIAAYQKEEVKHQHTIVRVDEVEPGCETNGYKAHYKCKECGLLFEDNPGQVQISEKDIIIKATGHKWDKGEVTKEATYDEEGIRTYTCSVCGETKTESIKKKERPSSYDDSDDSSSDDSDSGSSSSSGSSSKRYTEAQAKVDQINNVSTYSIPENHQVESGVPASDVGGRWANSADADTWTYTKSDGTLAKSEWMSLDYNGLRYWYYFDASGNMQTNWFDYNGKKFYLMPDKDGWRGRMATGWKKIDNKWYYFDITPGETQGSMYTAAITPDGHTVGADGAWNGVGATPVGQE